MLKVLARTNRNRKILHPEARLNFTARPHTTTRIILITHRQDAFRKLPPTCLSSIESLLPPEQDLIESLQDASDRISEANNC